MAQTMNKLYFLLKINLYWDSSIPPIDFDINQPLPKSLNEINIRGLIWEQLMPCNNTWKSIWRLAEVVAHQRTSCDIWVAIKGISSFNHSTPWSRQNDRSIAQPTAKIAWYGIAKNSRRTMFGLEHIRLTKACTYCKFVNNELESCFILWM